VVEDTLTSNFAAEHRCVWGAKWAKFLLTPLPGKKNEKSAALGKKYNVTHPGITDGRNSKAVAFKSVGLYAEHEFEVRFASYCRCS
jgi:hypothetical protein